MTRTLTAAFAYFAIIFGVGFLFGLVRIPLLVPRLGERTAELIEMPFMLVAIYFAARWVVNRWKLGTAESLFAGVFAAAVLLFVEFSIVLWIRGLTIGEFLSTRDPVAGAAYYMSVGIFALMPAAISYIQQRRRNNG